MEYVNWEDKLVSIWKWRRKNRIINPVLHLYIKDILITPRDVSVSSKHVLVVFDDGNCVIVPVAPGMEIAESPAVSGGAVAQQPLWIIPNSRCKELQKGTDKETVVW